MIDPGRRRRRKRLFDLPHFGLLHHHNKTSSTTTSTRPTRTVVHAQEHNETTASKSTMTHSVIG